MTLKQLQKLFRHEMKHIYLGRNEKGQVKKIPTDLCDYMVEFIWDKLNE
jgi:hypothetical protein